MPNINPNNLKVLRANKGWSLERLAHSAQVDRQTIHRIESGKRTRTQETTLARLARALECQPSVLTGSDIGQDRPSPGGGKMSINMSTDARNALSLVALRFKVKPSAILHLAPLLFLWAAEESLKVRRRRLERLEEHWSAIWQDLPRGHMNAARASGRADMMMDEERASIRDRDLFGTSIPDDLLDDDYEESEDNPMAAFLRGLAGDLEGLAEFEAWSRYWDEPGYTLGREEVVRFVGDDHDAAEHIVRGEVALHEIPADLLDAGDTNRIAEWVRAAGEAWHQAMQRADEAFREQVDQAIAARETLA